MVGHVALSGGVVGGDWLGRSGVGSSGISSGRMNRRRLNDCRWSVGDRHDSVSMGWFCQKFERRIKKVGIGGFYVLVT